MVRFIKQEAEEKANEIKVSSEEVSLDFWRSACLVFRTGIVRGSRQCEAWVRVRTLLSACQTCLGVTPYTKVKLASAPFGGLIALDSLRAVMGACC